MSCFDSPNLFVIVFLLVLFRRCIQRFRNDLSGQWTTESRLKSRKGPVKEEVLESVQLLKGTILDMAVQEQTVESAVVSVRRYDLRKSRPLRRAHHVHIHAGLCITQIRHTGGL